MSVVGNLVDAIKALFTGNTTNAASQSGARVPIVQADGTPIGNDSMANLAAVLGGKTPILRSGNVLIASYDNSYLRFRQIDEAAAYANSAVGVAIIEGGHCIIVARDEQASTKWADSNVAGGTTALGREAAIADFSGRSKTATIISTLGSEAPAATYCKSYYPTVVDSDNAFSGAGRWWLPSMGELVTIWAHLFEVNAALAAIGGTQLSRSTAYWSSTESSATGAWALYFDIGSFSYGTKTHTYSVRPVSALY